MQIFYFTGTGNSLAIAREINLYFKNKGKLISIADLQDKAQVKITDDVVGFIFPCYLGDIPWVAKEFLLKLTFENSPYIFAAVDCSVSSKEGLASISGALAQKGQKLALGTVMQVHGNCLPLPEMIEQYKVKKLPQRIQKFAESIAQKEVSYKGKSAVIDDKFVSNTREKLNNMSQFTVTEDCKGCGLCERVCPLGNIKLVDKKPVYSTNCAECWACFHWCPQKAIRSKAKGLADRRRYHNPKVKVNEIYRKRNA